MKKTRRTATFEGVKLDHRWTLARLLSTHKLYDMDDVAEISGLHVRYVRQLCRENKVDHHKLLGRYYMTPAEAAALLTPVKSLARGEGTTTD